MRNIYILLLIIFNTCIELDLDVGNSPNEHLTFTKSETERRIYAITVFKMIDCGFSVGQSVFLGPIGNDEDPAANSENKDITYEKKAVNRCLNSILFINCPTFPPNTTQATEEMTKIIISNRFINCTFNPIKFFEFNKPLSGSI